MSSRDVEFRLLQLVVSAVGDERVTIALVHWDGAQLRFAANPKRVPPGLGPGGDSVRVTLRALRQRFAREIRGQGLLDLGVELIHHGVPEGRGGLLYWSPLRRGRTQSSESHFRRLVDELDLRIPRETTPARESRSIGPLLSRLGEKLRASLASPDRVLVHNRVRGLREYDSPLSWQNHHWHHSFPLQLHREEPERIVLRVEAVLGRIDVSIPLDARAAVVAAHPESPRFADKLSEVAEFVSRTHGEKVRIVRAPIAKGQPPSTVELESWIRRDVG